MSEDSQSQESQQWQALHNIFAAKKMRIAICWSQYNELVTKRLCDDAASALEHCGINRDDIFIQSVPGAFELPLATQWLLNQRSFAAVIALGAVVQGDTDHHLYISQAVTQQLMTLSLANNTPIGFGLLTTANSEQAIDRSHGYHSSKGKEAALTAVEMLRIQTQLKNTNDTNPEQAQLL